MDSAAAVYCLNRSIEGLTEAHRGVLKALDRIAATYDRHVSLLEKESNAASTDPVISPPAAYKLLYDAIRANNRIQTAFGGGDPSSPPPGQPSPPPKRRARPRAPRG